MRCRACQILSEYNSPDLPRSLVWQTTLDNDMPSSPDDLRVLLVGFVSCLAYGLRLHGFMSTWSYLIIKGLATRTKFLESSGYHIVISSAITFRNTNIFSSEVMWPRSNSQSSVHEFHYTFIYLAFKSHTEWINAQRVSAPTTTLLPTTTGTYYRLNCFSHVIYAAQTSTYQNIV